ncbi:MAG: hypothetical protein HZA02_04780 [Nitrospinae bacterium]|nr:hypothetical protein [Nitrospinota bacterium]
MQCPNCGIISFKLAKKCPSCDADLKNLPVGAGQLAEGVPFTIYSPPVAVSPAPALKEFDFQVEDEVHARQEVDAFKAYRAEEGGAPGVDSGDFELDLSGADSFMDRAYPGDENLVTSKPLGTGNGGKIDRTPDSRFDTEKGAEEDEEIEVEGLGIEPLAHETFSELEIEEPSVRLDLEPETEDETVSALDLTDRTPETPPIELDETPSLETLLELSPAGPLEVEPEPALGIEPEPAFELEPEPELEIETETSLELEPEPALGIEPEPSFELEPEPELEIEPGIAFDLDADEEKYGLTGEEPAQEIEPAADLGIEPELELGEPEIEFELEDSSEPSHPSGETGSAKPKEIELEIDGIKLEMEDDEPDEGSDAPPEENK